MLFKRHTALVSATRVSHRRLYTSISVLPLTIALLWGLKEVNADEGFLDFVGIVATALGTIGTVFFFLMFFRLQVQTSPSHARRWTLLGIHLAVMILLLMGIRWLGFFSPWSTMVMWGNYDIQTASRTWIITVLSFGSLTLFASILDFHRQSAEDRVDGREEGRG